MKAKEMFEELGYELVNKAPMLWQFNDGGFIKNIEFSKSLESITFSNYEYYNDGKSQEEYRINIQELQAINKQVEELGWLGNKKMSEELMITKEDLVNWLNRPPSDDDLDLIGFITTRLENFYKLEQENKQLKEDKKKVIEYIKEHIGYYYDEDLDEYVRIDEVSGDEILKILGDKE